MGVWQGPLFPNISSQPANDLIGCPTGCLFNVFDDPGEQGQKLQYPKLFAKLMDRLAFMGGQYSKQITQAHNCISAEQAYRANMVF